MIEPLLRIYCVQVWQQCLFVWTAEREIAAAIENDDNLHLFFGIQNLLNAAGIVSNTLWGQQKAMSKEREPLRYQLEITDQSPFMSVLVRNRWAHFDEYLDKHWDLVHISRQLPELSDLGVVRQAGEKPLATQLRGFNTATWTATFLGEEHDLKPVIEEARRVIPIAKRLTEWAPLRPRQ